MSFCVVVEEEHEAEDHNDCDAELYEDELMCLHERESCGQPCVRGLPDELELTSYGLVLHCFKVRNYLA